jgi:IstB-like ATP binding protein/ABC-2 type transporter
LPGTGKTHLSIAISIRACLAGHRVAFATATEWVARLAEAKRHSGLDAELRRLSFVPLVVVDEVGYIPFDPEAANLMFSLVSARYERASMIVTSNKPFSACGHRPLDRPAHDRGGASAMTALAYTVTDSATMLRRNLKHQLRYPSVTLMLVGMPIVFLLLFVYVFGGQLGAGLGTHPHGDRTAYLTYVVPGILIMTVASAALGTALSVAMDMTEGIIDRFRTMAIARGAVLTGHVVGSLIQTIRCGCR